VVGDPAVGFGGVADDDKLGGLNAEAVGDRLERTRVGLPPAAVDAGNDGIKAGGVESRSAQCFGGCRR